jgi:hypothetical protein
MEPDLSLDCEFRAKSRGWSWPIRSIVSLLVVVALCSLSLTVMARGPRRQSKRPTPGAATSNVPQKPVLPPKKAPAPGVPAKVMPLRRTDRFVIVADPEIDPKIVVKADPDIDPEMVFNPEAGARQSLRIAPVAVPGNRSLPQPPPSRPGRINPNGRNQQPR